MTQLSTATQEDSSSMSTAASETLTRTLVWLQIGITH